LYFLPTATSASDAGTNTLAIVTALPFEPIPFALSVRDLDLACFPAAPAETDRRGLGFALTVKPAG
jgi:hypothetical protein